VANKFATGWIFWFYNKCWGLGFGIYFLIERE